MKKIIFSFILSLLYFIFYTGHVHAQDINIGVYPPIFQADTTPPAEISTPLTVYNFSDSPIDLRVVIKPFKQGPKEAGDVAFIDQGPTEDFIKKNVQILNEENVISTISLAGKEIKKLSLKVNIPEKQDRSDYYFSVIFMSNPTVSETSTSQGGIASNVLVSVGPKGATKGEIKEFSAPFFIQNGPVPFSIKMQNSSNHFITPKGYVLVKKHVWTNCCQN